MKLGEFGEAIRTYEYFLSYSDYEHVTDDIMNQQKVKILVSWLFTIWPQITVLMISFNDYWRLNARWLHEVVLFQELMFYSFVWKLLSLEHLQYQERFLLDEEAENLSCQFSLKPTKIILLTHSIFVIKENQNSYSLQNLYHIKSKSTRGWRRGKWEVFNQSEK